MQPTLAQALVNPVSVPNLSLKRDVILVMLGSLFMALLAQVRLHLPFTPVPLTGQTLGVLLVGASLGSRRGASAMALYLLEGAFGMPVLADATFGLTGGYLLGFIPAAFIVGLLAERGLDRSWKTALPAFLAGHLVIFAAGVSWLATLLGLSEALRVGFYPFLLSDLVIKTALASAILPSAWALVGQRRD